MESILRSSVVRYITIIFRNFNEKYDLKLDDYASRADSFEKELHDISEDYLRDINVIKKYMMINDGYFPDDILGIKYMKSTVTVSEILSYEIDDNPREKITKMFVDLLYANNKDKNLCLDIAKNIEKSCYNAVIKNSKQSEDPPCRQWDSPVFMEIYSNRCGIIYNLLDPNSNTCKLYGSNLLDKLFSGEIDSKEIGFKSEKELCPQATQKERDEIAIRSEQHVVEKESNLFRCPNCKERRVTYREVQLRALDEAPDFLCRCLNCKHRFKGK